MTDRHPTFATTMYRFIEAGYGDAVRFIQTCYTPPQKHTLLDEIVRVAEILRETKDEKVVLFSSSSGKIHPDILAGILMRFRRKPPAIALLGAMWEPTSGLRGMVERLVLRLFDPVVKRYIVQSTEELDTFPEQWNLSRNKMRLCVYFYSVKPDELLENPPQDDFIFAGGNSKREYEPLIEAARQLPHIRFVIATHLLDGRTDLPSNVEAGKVSHERFMELMQTSRAVVIPMQLGLKRAAGQQTYLNAMLMRKPVIVSECFGVRDHINHGVDGMIVDGSAKSYQDAIEWIYDDTNQSAVQTMSELASQRANTEFTIQEHVKNLLNIMYDLVDETSFLPSNTPVSHESES